MVDRRQEISGLQSFNTILVGSVVHVAGHLPGVVRYLAAVFNEDGCRNVSKRRPTGCHPRVPTCLAKLS